MTRLEERIQERLNISKPEQKKQILIFLKPETIEQLDAVARTFTKHSMKTTTRNMLIEDAVEAYIEDAKKIFEEKDIELITERESYTNREQAQEYDTVVLPAHEDGFREVFLNERKWYYVRIDKRRIPKLKYIAIYVSSPVSQITHYAKIAEDGFTYDENEKKFIIHFDGEAVELENPVPLGSISAAATRKPKYTTLRKLLDAKEYKDL